MLAPDAMIERSISAPSMWAPAPIDVYGPMYASANARSRADDGRADDHARAHGCLFVDEHAPLDLVAVAGPAARVDLKVVEGDAVEFEEIEGIALVVAPRVDQKHLELASGVLDAAGNRRQVDVRAWRPGGGRHAAQRPWAEQPHSGGAETARFRTELRDVEHLQRAALRRRRSLAP